MVSSAHLAMSTVAQTISETALRLVRSGVEESEAALEARLLYQHVVKQSPERIVADMRESADPDAIRDMEDLVARRERREPLAHIVGKRDFYCRTFKSDSRGLVPRPESELIIEHAVEFVRGNGIMNPRIADIGTGSGVLAVTMSMEIPSAEVVATDISPSALMLAEENAVEMGIGSERVEFLQHDIRCSSAGLSDQRFDVVISNPPYLRTTDIPRLEPEVADWEPRAALDGGSDGMEILKPLISRLPQLLREDCPAASFIEIDPPVARECLNYARRVMPYAETAVYRDYASLERVLAIRICDGV